VPTLRFQGEKAGGVVTLLRFIAAAFAAALFNRRGKVSLWRRFKDLFWLLWDSRTAPKVDAVELEARNKACGECPIYYRPLMTCGSPFADDPALGCWCVLPIKARMKHARCWLRIRGSNTQWGWRE
jgi:hypothetical protein